MAILITLLVLELGVAAGAEEDLLQGIFDAWPSYLAYFASFFTVGAFWLRHHALTKARNRALLDPGTTDEQVRDLGDALTPSVLEYVVAILVGLAVPYLAVALYFVVAVLIALPLGTLRAVIRGA